MIRRALRRWFGIVPTDGTQVIGDVKLPDGYEPPSGLLPPPVGVRVHVRGPVTDEQLIEDLAAAVRRTVDDPSPPEPLGTAVGTGRLDLGHVEGDVDAALDRYAGGRLADLHGHTVTFDLPDADVTGLRMFAETLDPAVALAELAPCCRTLLQVDGDKGVAACSCGRRRIDVTDGAR